MSRFRKQIVRYNLWIDPVFGERLAAESDIDLTVCEPSAPADSFWPALSAAHVFHVSPAKDELPPELFVQTPFLQRCPNLLCVSSGGAGYDTIDVADCTAAGVAVVNQAGGNAVSVAEMALGLMLDVSRRISESDRKLRGARGFSREHLMGREISGKVLGVVGIGETGSRVARLAQAFGMPVLACDPFVDDAKIRAMGATKVSFEQLLAQSDFVSVHCPRDASTMAMFNARTYAAMKPGAIFISTARGGIHDEAALADALASGHLGGAGLDVWHPEPPPIDSPLLRLDNVVATYHTAGVTGEARRNVAAIAADQIVSLMNGHRPPRLINPQVWPDYVRRFERITGHKINGAA